MKSMKLHHLIQEEADEDANIIFGTVIDENMEDEIRITVIATGFDDVMKKKADAGQCYSFGRFPAGRFIDTHFYAQGKNSRPGQCC